MAKASARHEEPPAPSPFARNVDSLRAAGYGGFLLAIVPPHLTIGGRVSTGKVPGMFSNRRWLFQQEWQKYQMSDADVERLKRAPDAGVGLRCGEVVALDLDFYALRGMAAQTQKVLSNLIWELVAKLAGVEVGALPTRSRKGSNSFMVFFRAADATHKRKLKFMLEGEEGGIELMAEGQQVVVAAHHASGAEVTSTLAEHPFAKLPVLDGVAIAKLWSGIIGLVERLGGIVNVNQARGRGEEEEEFFEPFDEWFFIRQIERKIMQDREVWLGQLGFPHHETGRADDTRVYSEDLMRDLEEDLAFYPDGIYDFGSRRRHSVLSLLQEFSSVDDKGELMFDPPAEYEQDPKVRDECWRVVHDHARRPTEAEAVAWFCRTVCERDDLKFAADATWRKDALPVLSRALLGLDLDMVRLTWASHWLSFPDELEPAEWKPEAVCQQAAQLPAMQAAMPTSFAAWRAAWERQGVDVEALIDAETKRVREAANENSGDGKDEWPAPKDLFGDGDDTPLQDIEKGVLPPVLHDHAHDVASRMGVSPAMTIVAGLAPLAAAIGSKWRIQPHPEDRTWTVPCIFWGLISMPPGGKKSPVIDAMTRPLTRLNQEWLLQDSATRKVVEARQKKLGKKAGVAIETPIRRCVTENFTIEAMRPILKDNPYGVLIRETELTALIYQMDAYKTTKGGDRGGLLKLADGGSHSVDRVGAGATNIGYWGASIIAGIQDDKIREMAPELQVDGMLQRFIPVNGGGQRPESRQAPDMEAGDAWDRVVRDIASLHREDPVAQLLFADVEDLTTGAKAPESEQQQRERLLKLEAPSRHSVIQLSKSADCEWSALQREIQELASLPGLSSAWVNHLSKWPGFSASLLLLVHVVERWPHVPEVVSVGTASRCIKLVHWLLMHALRFYEQNIGAGATADDARRIAGFLLANEGKAVKCRKTGVVTRAQVGQALGQSNAAAEAGRNVRAMTFLSQHGWCQPDENRYQDRHGPQRWLLNPLLFDGRFADHAMKEKARRAEVRLQIHKAVERKRRMQQPGVW